MIMGRVSGVAIMTSEIEPALIDNLRRQHVPVVYLDLGEPGPFVSNILVDYETGIYEAVEHFSSLGHTAIGFISGPDTLRSARQRLHSFERCVARLGIRPSVDSGDMKEASGEIAAARLLALPDPPTAILAANDLMAFGALRAIRTAALRVPEDVSVIGFDDIFYASLTEPPLTTVELDRADLGKIAAGALHKLATSDAHTGAEYRVGTRLVIRQSTAEAATRIGAQRRVRPRLKRAAGAI
jgi:LacI family transcriptional regulator